MYYIINTYPCVILQIDHLILKKIKIKYRIIFPEDTEQQKKKNFFNRL